MPPKLTPFAKLTPRLNGIAPTGPNWRLPLRSEANPILPDLRPSLRDRVGIRLLLAIAASLLAWLVILAVATGAVMICAALLACV